MSRVLLAPDKFKGTLTAAEVASALAAGIVTARPGTEVVTVALSDGGDGLLDAAIGAGFTEVGVRARDAMGTPRDARYARRGRAAVIELAEIAGLAGLEVPAPTTATTAGVGDALAAALDAGCTDLTLGIGGSASTDGGLGMVQALGVVVADGDGLPVTAGADVARARSIDLRGRHASLTAARLTVACDVDNPLTGPHGAAAVYGPQKGATPEQVRLLDAALAHWADLVAVATGADRRDLPGAGAAGGAGFAAVSLLGATLRPGAELVLDMTGFDAAVAGADLVITGEGSLDVQTLRGKGPHEVARRAAAAGVPVVAVAGQCLLDAAQARDAGLHAVRSLTERAGSREIALAEAGRLLREIGAGVAEEFLPG